MSSSPPPSPPAAAAALLLSISAARSLDTASTFARREASLRSRSSWARAGEREDARSDGEVVGERGLEDEAEEEAEIAAVAAAVAAECPPPWAWRDTVAEPPGASSRGSCRRRRRCCWSRCWEREREGERRGKEAVNFFPTLFLFAPLSPFVSFSLSF